MTKTNSCLAFIDDQKLSLYTLLCVGFCLKFIIVLFYNHPQMGDAITYDLAAQNILSYGKYEINGHVITHYPPLYSLFLSFLYLPFGHNLWIVKFTHCFLGTISCFFSYKISRIFLSHKASLLSTVLVTFNPLFLMLPARLLSENLALPLFFIFFFMLIQSNSYPIKMRRSLALGFLFGIILLVRSIAIAFIPFILIYSIWYKFSLLEFFYSIRSLLFFFLGFFLALSPWIARNYSEFNEFIPLSTSSGITLYSSYDFKILGNLNSDYVSKIGGPGIVAKMSRTETDSALKKLSMQYILQHLEDIPSLTLKKFWYFWSPFDWDILSPDGQARNPGFNYVLFFIMPFFLYGLALLLFKSSALEISVKSTFILLFPILLMISIALIFLGLSRFRMFIEPLITIVSVFGLLKFRNLNIFNHTKKYYYAIVSCWFISGLTLFVCIVPLLNFYRRFFKE
ncbi:MAG: glycosyltransferase family 39 protein [Oligoflexia bacterium]|nr:glycosyltransferase family 39 protein [Oligoflexia bacterium]